MSDATVTRVGGAVLGLACLLGLPGGARAQDGPPPETWRLGVFFWHPSPNDLAALDGIRAALRECGRPHELLVRQAAESREKAIRILDEFRTDGVRLVFAMGTQAALLAAERIREIPVVFTAVTNPVESGVVPAWEGSGRNLAGNSNWIAPETVLRVFRLAVPKLTKLGLLRSRGSGVVSAAELQGMRRYLARPGVPRVEVEDVRIDRVEEIPRAVEQLVEAGVQAIWIPIDFLVYQNMNAVLAAVRPHRVPLVSSSLRGTRTGAVAGILVDYAMLGQRAVVLALDILERRADPTAIRIGTMKGFQIVVNLEAARACGYELPLSLLAVADVIHEHLEGSDGERDRGK